MKFTFIGDHANVPGETYHTRGCYVIPTKTTLEFEAETIDIVLLQFKQFLQGCGYVVDGEIEIYGGETSPGAEITDRLREELHRGSQK